MRSIVYVVGADAVHETAFVEVLNDADGSWVNTDDMVTTGPAYAGAVVTDPTGNAYVVGQFSGTLTPTRPRRPS